MGKVNPKKAVSALLPLPIPVPGGAVRPLTLGVWAVLERIKSPLLGETPVDGALSLLPSLYVLTHDPMDSLEGDLFRKSVEWADTLPPGALKQIRDAARRQMQTMLDVVPQLDEEDRATAKKTTGRSPLSQDGRPATPDGAGAESSGTSPSRRSASSAGRTRSTQTGSTRSRSLRK